MAIRSGQRVWIKPEYQDKGDENYSWYAIEDEDGGRVAIRAEPNPLGPGAIAHPWTRVSVRCLTTNES